MCRSRGSRRHDADARTSAGPQTMRDPSRRRVHGTCCARGHDGMEPATALARSPGITARHGLGRPGLARRGRHAVLLVPRSVRRRGRHPDARGSCGRMHRGPGLRPHAVDPDVLRGVRSGAAVRSVAAGPARGPARHARRAVRTRDAALRATDVRTGSRGMPRPRGVSGGRLSGRREYEVSLSLGIRPDRREMLHRAFRGHSEPFS